MLYTATQMGFKRSGSTVLLVDNLPEMFDSFNTSWWRKRVRGLKEPARRLMEGFFLELGNVIFVVVFLGKVTVTVYKESASVAGPFIPYVLIAGATISAFSVLF